jgi:hypothetical protein
MKNDDAEVIDWLKNELRISEGWALFILALIHALARV